MSGVVEPLGVEGEVKADPEVKVKSTPGRWRNCCLCRIVLNVFDPSLFKSWAVRIWLLSAILGATNQYILTYIPTMSVKKGASPDQAALLLVITGVVDLASRFVVGYISDLKWLQATSIVAIAQVCLGVCCHCGRFATTFHSLLVWLVVTGVFLGIRFSLLPMVLIQLVGVETMSRVFSLTAFISTMSAAAHGPLLNGAMEYFNSYDPVLHYVGFALIITGIIITLLPKIATWDKNRTEKNKNRQETSEV